MVRQPENMTLPDIRRPGRFFTVRAAKILAGAVEIGTIVAVAYAALQLPFFQTNASQSPGDNDVKEDQRGHNTLAIGSQVEL